MANEKSNKQGVLNQALDVQRIALLTEVFKDLIISGESHGSVIFYDQLSKYFILFKGDGKISFHLEFPTSH